MRSLVVAQDFPWPTVGGSLQRLDQVIGAASELGPTDLFAFVPPRRTEPCVVPATVTLGRLHTVASTPPPATLRRRFSWLGAPGLPLEVAGARDASARHAFDAWEAGGYDFVWFSKGATFELLGRPRLGPTVVDLDDLEDHKILGRIAVMRSGPRPSWRARPRRAAAIVQARVNAARWGAFQRSVARDVERVVVCSDVDGLRLRARNVAVVPNGYAAPRRPVGRAEVGDPPTVLFCGTFGYPPNSDAARWLVSEVMPRVRAEVPDVRVRLVGEPDGWVARLDDPPRVTVVGRVPEIEPELARSDAVAVPVRYGSGTRVKILEAFAHRLPVVATSVGSEGLGLEPGRQLLVADDAASFASACARLLVDHELRRRLVDSAQKTFLEHHQWSEARRAVRELMHELASYAADGTVPESDHRARI